jgi:hypothetical protein
MSFSDLNRSAYWLLTRSRNCSQTFRILVGEGLVVGETVSGSETAVAGVGLEVGDGVAGLVIVPVFQTSLFPDLIQVKVLFPRVCLVPILAHVAPLFTAEKAGAATKDAEIEMTITTPRSLFIDAK